MAKFLVEVDVSGYYIGSQLFEVEADSEEHAAKIYYEGEVVDEELFAQDIEDEIISIRMLEE